MMEIMEMLLTVVVVAILAMVFVDLTSEKRQISNMIAAISLIVLGAVLLLFALHLWLSIAITVLKIGGKEYVAVLTEDFSKIIGAVSFGTAGMAIITGGFSLIAGGKYEVKLTSTEPIKGIEVKK